MRPAARFAPAVAQTATAPHNERPGGVMYNYATPLSQAERIRAYRVSIVSQVGRRPYATDVADCCNTVPVMPMTIWR